MQNIVTLGEINDALKFTTVTAAQLAEMGFTALANKPICEALPQEEARRLRTAKLYPAESIGQIRVALAKRLAAPASCLHQIKEPAPVLAAPVEVDWLQKTDLEALERFEETASDSQGHDIGKAAVARLAGFGCLQSHGFGVYSITEFGHFVMDDWEHARALPFRTQAERDADQRAAIAAAKGE